VYYGTADPEIRHVDIPVKNIPPELAGMRIAVISDMHISNMTPSDYVRKIADKVNAENPDMVLILGDVGDGMPEDLKEKLEPIRDLHPRCGVFGVPGNHEYYHGYYTWEKFMRSLGVKWLCNESVRVPGLPEFHAAGIADAAIFKKFDDDDAISGDMQDIPKAFKGIPQDAFIVFLCHSPLNIREISESGASVIFSGHTHGGMFPGPHWIPMLFSCRHISGLHRMYHSQLCISRGAGNWHVVPIRLFAPKEIIVAALCAEP